MNLFRAIHKKLVILLLVSQAAMAGAPLCAEIFSESSILIPNLLKSEETKLQTKLGSETQDLIARRGLTLPNYYGPDLVRFIFGDWSKAIGSHDFTRKLYQKISLNIPPHQAAQEAGQEILLDIEKQISELGYRDYAILQSRNTYLGIKIEEKKANGMSSYTTLGDASEVNKTPSPFGYARTAYTSLVNRKNMQIDQPMIVLDVNVKAPLNHVMKGEYIIPSHISPTDVHRFYLGFSNWHNIKDYAIPPEMIEKWYVFEIITRDKSGKPKAIVGREIFREEVEDRQERWKQGSLKWDSRQVNTEKSLTFEAQNPLLEKTLKEIKALLQ